MSVKCEFCGKEFDDFRGLNGHMNAHREPSRLPGTSGSVQLHGHTVHHRHGVDVLLAATSDGAQRELYKYVKDWWGDLDLNDDEGEPIPCPEDMDEAINRYYDPERGVYDEYAEECNPVVDPTEGMEIFISGDRFKKRHSLNIRFTSEGLIMDFMNMKTGKVVKTTSVMYDEIVEAWLK